jgi:predicted O-methyltransferase YrrM
MPPLLKDIEGIKGFLDAEEGQRLHEIALDAARMGPCLEIGSYCGKSTLWIGSACRINGAILFSIDHHRGSEEHQPGELYFDPELFDPVSHRVDTFRTFRDTLLKAGLCDTVVPMVAPSAVCARQWATPLSLVFIDGGHSFESALTDYSVWARHLLPGGYLLIHDIFLNSDEGGQAPHDIYRLALQSGEFETLPMTGTLGVLRRLNGHHLPPINNRPQSIQ